jgi:hypothetical protein|tara:strand:+ start:37 stop:402 length:366 start_codon:yes stop_codon:yes gene_type:complete
MVEKYLYFASAAPDGTAATEQVVCFPAAQMSHMEYISATSLRIYFESSQENDADSGIDAAHAVLTVASGKHKEAIKDIVQAIAEPSIAGSNVFVNIADSENSEFCSAHITACASIAVVDAS